MSNHPIPSPSSPLTTSPGAFRGLVGTSPPMRRLFELIPRLAASDLAILIHGPSGVGKEGVARAIHDESPRRDGPFLVINCATLSSEMATSEFFGHVKGAFSGAIADSPGYFGDTDGGTLVLDEIGDLPLRLQPLLLRAIDAQEVIPVGSTKVRRVSVRIVASSHVDLALAVDQGRFRRDLYTRLRGALLRIPSLDERREDLPLLIAHFLSRFERGGVRPQLTPGAVERLLAHPFPGNARELGLAIGEAVLIAKDLTAIRADELNLDEPARASAAVEVAAVVTTVSPARPSTRSQTLATIIREAKVEALERHHGNLAAAAAELGVSLSTMKRFSARPSRRRRSDAQEGGPASGGSAA